MNTLSLKLINEHASPPANKSHPNTVPAITCRMTETWITLLTWGVLLAVPAIAAEGPVWFFEHFGNGNVHDDAPVSWSNGGYNDTMSASTGDLTLTPQPELASALVDGASYEDVSLLTRVSLTTPGFTDAGLVARHNGTVAYTAGITGNRFGTHDNSLVLTYGGLAHTNFRVLGAVPTNLDPSSTDVLLQFDVVGDLLSLYAWADGTTRPAQPQLSVYDGRLSQGAIGTFLDSDGSRTNAIFREFLAMPAHNGTLPAIPVRTSVPEPANGAMALVGLATMVLARRSICRARRPSNIAQDCCHRDVLPNSWSRRF